MHLGRGVSMLMNETEVDSRLNSPDNLINKLRLITRNKVKDSGMEIFGVPTEAVTGEVVSLPPTADDLFDDFDSKIKKNMAKTSAMDTLVDAIGSLHQRLPEIDKAETLSRVARDMSSVLKQMNEADAANGEASKAQIIIWKPVMMQGQQFATVHVNE